jgi:hypothetical protein
MDNLDVFFEDIRGDIKPSVLHGDLWSGNIAGVEGQPSIFDPATYYGHHEAEFGMSWCAGGLEQLTRTVDRGNGSMHCACMACASQASKRWRVAL